jgi:splicing factor 3A subunit 3
MLERKRAALEDVECYERMAVHLLDDKPKAHRDRVLQNHRVSVLLDRVVERSEAVAAIDGDQDGLMKAELDSMKGDAAFTSFYERLGDLRDFHRRYPDAQVQHQPDPTAEDLQPTVQFSGEEMFGKYLDLHQFFERSCNMPQFERMDYVSFLGRFSSFEAIAPALRNKTYLRYLSDLKQYLVGFYRRTQPLVDLDDVLAEDLERFGARWDEEQKQLASPEASVDLSAVSSASELERLGLDGLKQALQAMGLKCGGTLAQRAARLFSVKGVPRDKISPKLLAKGQASVSAPGGGGGGAAATAAAAAANKDAAGSSGGHAQQKSLHRRVAEAESQIRKLCELLAEVIENTARQVQVKQTRTHEELEAEAQEEEEGVDDIMLDDADGSEEDEPLYNPLNLPLGWDGKPIPYWLYKLHGLGVEYKCEICGNFSYWGRRAFDRHFQEWRHAHGMRCLKIPNTKHFHDITLIEDAINLYAKIKDSLGSEAWQPETGEEMEDSLGNVLDRKTYEDLLRQDLL